MTRVQARATDVYRALIVCGAFEPGYRGGGPIRSLARIVDTASSAVEVQLVTRDRDLGDERPYPRISGQWVRRGRHTVFYLGLARPSHWWKCLRAVRAKGTDLLYVNSLFSPIFSVLPVLLSALRIIPTRNILIAPRGELSPGALTLKSRKKAYFLRVWRPVVSSRNVVFHASNEMEAQHIRRAFPATPVLVNGNQTAPDGPAGMPLPAEPQDLLRLVFIGRISPKKGLDTVLQALGRVREAVALDIYGPREDRAYWDACNRLLQALPANIVACYRGELKPREVRETFAQYDAFAFPTLGENFGHVIAESLEASCPVIAPDTTPWTVVLETGGGTVLESCGVDAVAGAVQRWASLSIVERAAAKRSASVAYQVWLKQQRQKSVLDEARLREFGEKEFLWQ